MTTANRMGPAVGMAQIRDAVLALATIWLPDYLADASETHGKARDYIAAPRTWQAADDVLKWPQSKLPAFLPGVSGTVGEPAMRGDEQRTYVAEWQITLGAIVGGIDDDDTELQASIYGAAMREMFLEQAAQMDTLDVHAVRLAAGEVYPPLPQHDQRYLLAPSVPFVVRLGGHASAVRSLLEPTDPPLASPGPYPTADIVTVDLEKS